MRRRRRRGRRGSIRNKRKEEEEEEENNQGKGNKNRGASKLKVGTWWEPYNSCPQIPYILLHSLRTTRPDVITEALPHNGVSNYVKPYQACVIASPHRQIGSDALRTRPQVLGCYTQLTSCSLWARVHYHCAIVLRVYNKVDCYVMTLGHIHVLWPSHACSTKQRAMSVVFF